MASSKNQNYLHGAAILAVAVVVVKLLGAVYKIPMANILDTEGYTHFTVAYQLYSVLLSLSTAGLPVAVARMISEADNLRRPNQVRKIFSTAMISFVVLGFIGTVAMFIFPTELAIFMEDVEATQSILVLAPSVILCCVMSAFRGYSQGLSDMRPTAVSQVIEVGVKVVFGIALLLILQSQGASGPIMSAGATSGVAVGSLFACIYIGVVATRRMKLEKERVYEGGADESCDKGSTVLKNLVKIGIPIAFGSCIFQLIALFSSKIILGQLQIDGHFTYEQAKDMFGTYSMAQTLYNLPLAIVTPITVSVIPAISGFIAVKRFGQAKSVMESSLRISTIISIPMAVGMSVLSAPIMTSIYNSGELGAQLLAIMGISSFFLCMSTMLMAILQAGGRERLPMITMIVGGVVTLVVTWFFVGNAEVNIYGAPIANLVCNVLMFAMNLIFLMTSIPEKPKLKHVFILPLINALVMGAVAWIMYPAVLKIIGAGPEPSRLITLVSLAVAVAAGVAVYAVLTIVTRSITKDDMMLIPKGEKLAKLLHIKDSGKH